MKGLAFMKSYHELKSGSDVRGYASDIFGNEIELTDKAVYDITAAFVPFLSKNRAKSRGRSPYRSVTTQE